VGRASTSPLSVTVGSSWEVFNATGSSCACAPPDPQVAVGPGDVVELVNTAGAISSRAGTIERTFTLDQFFGGRP
jgi:hypothetical protein